MKPSRDLALQAGHPRSIEVVAAEISCTELLVALAAYIDQGRAGDAITLFTDDAELGSGASRCVGREQIADVLRSRQQQVDRRTRHVVTNIQFTAVSSTEAAATSLLTLYVLGGSDELIPRALTVFHDVFALARGGWRIAKRVPTVLAGSQ